jgi:hypothetical protein
MQVPGNDIHNRSSDGTRHAKAKNPNSNSFFPIGTPTRQCSQLSYVPSCDLAGPQACIYDSPRPRRPYALPFGTARSTTTCTYQGLLDRARKLTSPSTSSCPVLHSPFEFFRRMDTHVENGYQFGLDNRHATQARHMHIGQPLLFEGFPSPRTLRFGPRFAHGKSQPLCLPCLPSIAISTR